MSLPGVSEPSGSGRVLLALILSLLSCLVSFVYETEHFNGVAELLEILGRFVDPVFCGSEDSGPFLSQAPAPNTSFCLQLFDLLFVSAKLSCVHD